MVTNHIFRNKLKIMALPFFALGIIATNFSVQPALGMEENEKEAHERYLQVNYRKLKEEMNEQKNKYIKR